MTPPLPAPDDSPRLQETDPEAASHLHLVGLPTCDWEAVYREHVVDVYRYVFARTGNRPDAEDVTAQTFLRALPRIRAGASFPEVRAYLFAAARSALADHWATHYGVSLGLEDVRAAADVGPVVDHSARVTAILEALPDRYRQVLELRFLRGFSVRETARHLGVSVANAKVLQWRALRLAARRGEGSR